MTPENNSSSLSPLDATPAITRREATARLIYSGAATAAGSFFLSSCAKDSSRGSSGAPSPPQPPAVRNVYIPPKAPPPIVGKAAIVVDNRTGRVLYAKGADSRRAVASTQKLLTGLLVVEGGGLNTTVTVAKPETLEPPYKLYLRVGERYTKRQLLEGLLIKSGNDVAHCLARNHAGSESAFASLMNQRARQLGMRNSRFVKSNGLPASNQYSTARDLSILARAALRYKVIPEITRKTKLTFRYSDGRVRTYSNTNKLLTQSRYCFGLKTGYTRAAGKCLISAGQYRNRTVVCVVLGSSTRSIWGDSGKLLHWGLGVA